MQEISLLAFHNAGKNTYKPVTPLPASCWPIEWKTTYYKEYPRFESIVLPHPDADLAIAKLTTNRKSERSFSDTGVTLKELSNILKHIGGEFKHNDGSVHRAQASGGARFAIEVYPIVRFSNTKNLNSGVYHYNVKEHKLEYLWQIDSAGVDPSTLVQNQWAENASVHIILTAVFWRSSCKYGNRSYRYICMEAGAMLQNAYLYAAQSNLKVVGYGGTNDDMVEKLLRIDGSAESVVGSCLIGK